MQVLQATIGQMLVLFSFILLGYLLAKLKAVPDNSNTVLSKLENNLFVPALVLGTFVSNFRVETLSSAWQLFLISFVICLVMMLLAVLVAKWCSKDAYIRKMYTYGLAFSNFGFMGNAVVMALFPDVFMEYLIYVLPFWTLIYVWGVPYLLMPSGEKKSIVSGLKKLINPMFISMIIGMLIRGESFSLAVANYTSLTITKHCQYRRKNCNYDLNDICPFIIFAVWTNLTDCQ